MNAPFKCTGKTGVLAMGVALDKNRALLLMQPTLPHLGHLCAVGYVPCSSSLFENSKGLPNTSSRLPKYWTISEYFSKLAGVWDRASCSHPPALHRSKNAHTPDCEHSPFPCAYPVVVATLSSPNCASAMEFNTPDWDHSPSLCASPLIGAWKRGKAQVSSAC